MKPVVVPNCEGVSYDGLCKHCGHKGWSHGVGYHNGKRFIYCREKGCRCENKFDTGSKCEGCGWWIDENWLDPAGGSSERHQYCFLGKANICLDSGSCMNPEIIQHYYKEKKENGRRRLR